MSKNQQILSLAILLVTIVFVSCSKTETGDFKVEKGAFTQTITETGELEAVNVRTFVMQRYGRYWYNMKIIGLLDHGSIVLPGDSVIQFDPSPVQRFIIDRETDLETQKANLEKIKVEIDNRRNDLQSNLKSEEAAFELKKLELEQFRFESEKAKRMKDLEFKQAQIRLSKVRKSISYYETISENQLYIQKILVNRVKEQINSAYEILPELTVRTPIPGIFQINNKRRSREQIKIGDEVYMGNTLGNVPDLTWMKVQTVVNEGDFMKIKMGTKVNVRLDALPNVIFEGEVSSISKLCRPKDRNSRLKIFDVEVKILVSDERLKPGMTVSCEYICAHYDNVAYVPLQCIDRLDDGDYIYLKTPTGPEKLEVKTGPTNSAYMVVYSDVKAGQKLVPVSQIYQTQNN